jgi:thiol-disulfide isomerase/thioredoxin
MELKSYWVFVAGFVVILLFVAMVVSRRPQQLQGMESFADGGCQFMMFGVPWCPHCVSAKPEFEKLGSTATIGGRGVSFVYVNPEEDPTTAAKYPVSGYPTFLLIKDGKQIPYSGGRNKGAFLAFLQENMA